MASINSRSNSAVTAIMANIMIAVISWLIAHRKKR